MLTSAAILAVKGFQTVFVLLLKVGMPRALINQSFILDQSIMKNPVVFFQKANMKYWLDVVHIMHPGISTSTKSTFLSPCTNRN